MPNPEALPQIEIATIEEKVVFSGGGKFAIIALICTQVLLLLSMTVAHTNMQEAAVFGTVWIASNVLWCTVAIIGRRRTYRMLRDQ